MTYILIIRSKNTVYLMSMRRRVVIVRVLRDRIEQESGERRWINKRDYDCEKKY